MKNRPIHENLDTSFVNLSALVKYLRRRQFIGGVRVELSGYDAEIVLTAENQIEAREHDRIAGRSAEGEEALRRILIRAREPGGIINVYQNIEEAGNSVAEKIEQPAGAEQIPVRTNFLSPLPNVETKTISAEDLPKPNTKLPPLPFELSNRVEARAKQNEVSASDWQTLIELMSELISVIDNSLSDANLDFSSAFEKARLEISGDYPFLNPVSGIFSYRDGRISMSEQISATLFVASLSETLRRILEKLGNNPKFSNVHRAATQNILALIRQRKTFYDKFFITPPLEKIIGV